MTVFCCCCFFFFCFLGGGVGVNGGVRNNDVTFGARPLCNMTLCTALEIMIFKRKLEIVIAYA